MFIGHADALSEMKSLKDQIVVDPTSELSDDEDEDSVEQIIYTASFQELAGNSVQYDTVIWLSVSLLLILAWGVGLIMLLYLPFRRYVLQKDLSSRELYVTPTEIVYKVSRPSFIPFWGIVTIEKHVPLALVIDIIIEQGCLQSKYGVHTFRVESIAHGKAAPVDELLVQGVSDPDILKKVIITAASNNSQDGRTSWKATVQSVDVETLTEGSVVLRSPSKSLKMMSPPQSASRERRAPSRLVLNRLEEINRTVKRLEQHFEKSYAPPDSS
ncbi:uncharacterized protein LOC114743338 isoform X1 [Neltuma alba]|uniref:uncharacterized protein LOC114726656 isoform X1 n=2 Tax=Neltuma alba TaxID=207710 RepID=UPI0010A332F1|nr:uncharacterized protein LOC114726656 isoform X1 [Prosopis alba]XP_028769157.1 uncharacterized protein LOC114726656 isoform X1 [Prosopis alba]XP_028787378.1 uncharacterized protein LOC114743338 isoform X1 [Prosopis alba]XP_028787379.1 uncharacterized protein LOC114743338 isoform X1 [Prosopis alba]XP_028787381.1 uncharacterized protein LOC114743338 isoform X1 [Prosopis alba]